MRRWPWITLAAVTILAITPIGRDFIYSAFLSNEQLSRNIAQPIFFMALAVAGVLVLLEWWIRRIIYKRRVEN